MNRKLSILSAAILFLMPATLTFTSCDNGDDPKPKAATSIELVSGGSQSALAGQTLANPVVVIVKDQNGSPFAGETVYFKVTEGSVSAASAVTNSGGKASVEWTLGATEGAQTLTVIGTSTLTGSPLQVTASANLQAASIELASGGSQEGAAGEKLTNPIEIIVKDQNGDPFAGEIVNFAVAEGSVSAATATTGANGKASTEWTLGATEGTKTLTITSTSDLTGSPLEVTATAKLQATSIELVSGGSQAGTTGEKLANPIEIIVKDQNGNPFAGENVHFDVTEGSVSATKAVTGDNGKARVEWTLGDSEGTQTLTITGTSDLTGSPLEVIATAEYTPAIGDFKYGGVIFYIDETGEHGLVCAVTDQSTGAEWGCENTVLIDGAEGTAIGTGAQNTQDIIAGCTTEGIAADLCAKLTLNSYDDWFLPSEDELYEMYLNKAAINTTALENNGSEFANEFYWSSTELGWGGAQAISLSDGSKNNASKSGLMYVRAIRKF